MTARRRTRLASRRRPSEKERRYLTAAAIAGVLLVIGTTFVFARQSLFRSGFELRAVVTSVNQLRNGSEVRIAGIKVGQIDGIGAGPRGTATIDMLIGDNGQPVHSDASLTVRPRLLLEGNAYVDLNPGSSGAPVMPAGAAIALDHTAVSVQLDQVLDVFTAPTRDALQSSVAGLSNGLGGDELRTAVHAFDYSLNDVTRVAHAIQGSQPGDLGHAVSGTADVTTQLANNPRALADSVTNFNRVMGDIAAEDGPLTQTIADFDALEQTAPASLKKIDQALPPLTGFASALRPALHAAPTTLTKASGLLNQIGALTQRNQLPRLLTNLEPVSQDLPNLERYLTTLFGYTNQVTGCIASHVVPALNTRIQDPPNTTGDPAWLDLLHGITGFTSASTSFDGNAGTFRAGLAFGATALQGVIPGIGTVAGQLDPNIEGVRPVWLGYGVEPPYRPDQSCASQPLPNLNAQSGPPPAWDIHKAASR